MKKVKSGFTLLEVVLVVAIATLLFMSVVIGLGSRIATGRYETASNEIADYLRDVYTVALNTENTREGINGAREYCTIYSATEIGEGANKKTGKPLFVNTNLTDNPSQITKEDVSPGRTNCAIYGKAIYFGNKGEQGAPVAHVFDVVGDVITNVQDSDKKATENTELKQIENKSILEQLEYVRADIFAAIPEGVSNISELTTKNFCRLSAAGAHTTYEPNWGALFKTANFGDNTGRDRNSDFVGMVMIVRAPASGNVSTFFYESPSSENSSGWEFINMLNDANDDGVGCGSLYQDSSEYKNIVEKYSPVQLIERQIEDDENNVAPAPENTGFCVGSDDFYVAISGLKKYIEFIPGGQNASAVKLNESNTTNKDEKGYNPCL